MAASSVLFLASAKAWASILDYFNPLRTSRPASTASAALA